MGSTAIGNALKSLWRWILIGNGTSEPVEDGVEVITNAGGMLGQFTKVTSAAAMVPSSGWIVTDKPSIDPDTLNHEYGHIQQARQLQVAYIPVYVVLSFTQAPLTMVASQVLGPMTGHRTFGFNFRDSHDANVMEWNAEMHAGKNLWQ